MYTQIVYSRDPKGKLVPEFDLKPHSRLCQVDTSLCPFSKQVWSTGGSAGTAGRTSPQLSFPFIPHMPTSLPCCMALLANLLPSAKDQADTSEEQFVGGEDAFTQMANPEINNESLRMNHTHCSDAPILGPPDAKIQLIGKDPDALGKIEGRRQRG